MLELDVVIPTFASTSWLTSTKPITMDSYNQVELIDVLYETVVYVWIFNSVFVWAFHIDSR